MYHAPATSCTMIGASTYRSRRDTVLSRREIEGLIASGRTVIIVDGKVLKVDAWLQYHPGGDKAIKHMVGRDATDEVNAFVYLLPSPDVSLKFGIVSIHPRLGSG